MNSVHDQRTSVGAIRESPLHLFVGRRSSHLPLLVILLLAFVLRLIVWMGPLHQLANDEVEYVTVARDLLAGRGWVFYESYHWLRAPLYNLFLAGSLWLANGNLHTAALFNIVLSVANVYLSYLLALRLLGQRAATLAALITAVLWTNVTFASLYMAETLFTFCFLVGLVFLLGKRRTTLPVFLSSCPLVFLSGLFFGLATLTRSASLFFLPIIAAWLVFQQTKKNVQQSLIPHPSSFILPLAFLLAATLTIAPWTIRNYLAYGHVIPVETGLAYNMWVFNEPRESMDEIHQTLEQIPNPGDRSDYAMAQGMARLREDPAILLRKLWPNWVYLTRVKPIEDRFVLESYYLDVRLPQFVAALVLDDALYLVIALAGITGLALYRRPTTDDRRPTTDDRPEDKKTRRQEDNGQRTTDNGQLTLSPRSLCALWLLYMVATMLLTHGEARYRHFLFPVLIPYAAWVLVQIVDCRLQIADWVAFRKSAIYNLQSAIICLVVCISFFSTYPYTWAAQNVARGWQQALGDVAWSLGNSAEAVRRYQRATEASSTTDAYLRLGNVARRANQLETAERAYRQSFRLARLWVAPSASLGDLLREQGREDEARIAFQGFYADEGEMLDWSWRYVTPAPRATLDIGDGLDFGYIDGMYPAEIQQGATSRWTNGRALLRLHMPTGATTLRLRLAAPHPGDANTTATVCMASHCTTFEVARTWRTYTLVLPPNSNTMPIELRSPTFSGGDRTLGLLVNEAKVE